MNAPADHHHIERAAIDGAVYIPCSLIQPSKTNPRKRFDTSYISSLAESIKKVGVFQPIIVRDLAGRVNGGPQYELVAGECRWRATQEAGQHAIPCLVRELDDMATLEIQMLENVKRKSLHPLEEAEGFEQMLRKPDGLRGFTAEELAERFNVSRRYIFNRLDLLKLVPFVREELYSDRLNASVAQRIARVPPELQEQACKECQQGWGGEAFSTRQAEEHLHKRYMLSLSKAVFDIKDERLLAKAGACPSCPKRTGANPDLFDDVKSADTCTDPTCFEAKTKAHGAREVKRAKEGGLTVLVGAETKKVMPYGEYSLESTGHIKLDGAAEELTGTKQSLTTLLGKDFAGAVVLKPEGSDVPIRVAKVDEVKAALKEKGLLKPSKKGTVGSKTKALTADDINHQRDNRIGDMLEARLPRAFCKHLADDGAFGLPDESLTWMRALADRLLPSGEFDTGELGTLITGKHQPSHSVDWLKEAPIEQVVQAILASLLTEHVADERFSYRKTDSKTSDALAKELGFDLAALRKEVTREIDAAIRDEIDALKAPLGKGKAPTKKAGAKVLPRYRNPATGDTWSGRGLQPAWLKAQLAQGRKLADFELGAPPAEAGSTPSISAAAQGAKSGPQTPEEALAAAVGQDLAKPTLKAAAGAAPKKKEVKVEPAQPPAKKVPAKRAGAGQGKGEQKVEPTQPSANAEAISGTGARKPKLGERWRVKAGAPGRSKTQGREGTVEELLGNSMVSLRWGERKHEFGVYPLDDVEFAAPATPPAAQLSPEAAWPFPKKEVTA